VQAESAAWVGVIRGKARVNTDENHVVEQARTEIQCAIERGLPQVPAKLVGVDEDFTEWQSIKE